MVPSRSKPICADCHSYGLPVLSILVPTYNERENISELTKLLLESLSSVNFELLFIDDNSPDGTADLAKELAEVYGNIRVIQRPGKMGLGSAVVDGVKAARGEFIAVMDADLQHPPDLLPRMFEQTKNGCSLAVASRYVDGGRIEGWSIWRRLVSLAAVKFAHLLLPKTRRIRDPMSGCFMLEKKCQKGVDFNPIGYKILLEMLVKGDYSGIVEVPYTFRPRRQGESKLDLFVVWNYVRHLLRLFISNPAHR
ncbi:MAG: polyprenol monophosphomannose synthase [Candidatus Bathyarchaeota archaeon]|nr:polyprenol monophosphomannose synthase [Candidatus Bathyarchaeota archaeon]